MKADRGHRRPFPVSGEVVRFALVGVSNTAISMAVYAGLLALGVGYVAGLANGYTYWRVAPDEADEP